MCNRELLMTPMVGGCLCIPSEEDRIYDLAGFINRHRVNFAYLTPTTASLLSPSDVPTLRVLLIGGAPIGAYHLTEWTSHVRVIYGYGASETAGAAILASDLDSGWDPRNIGFACDSCLWVVNADDPNRLVPIGAVGELLIQGKGLAREYLGDETRTRSVFLQTTDWQRHMAHGYSAPQERLYRTGDLVRYNLDGSIHYIGRKDNQVKVNGQRVELEEVEYHIRDCPELVSRGVRNVVAIAVNAAVTREGTVRTQLVAFIEHDPSRVAKEDEREHQGVRIVHSDLLAKGLEQHLLRSVPRYMIPVHFFFVCSMPMTKSGKLDRLRLQAVASDILTAEDSDQIPNRCAATAEELVLQEIWMETLGLQHKPRKQDDFFRQSGDSIAATKLVGRLREKGFMLSVADVFKHRTLERIASVLCSSQRVTVECAPFSLITANITLLNAVMKQIKVEIDDIEDIYPCTPMQEGLMSLSIKNPGSYWGCFTWTLPSTVDLQLFRAAWQTVWMNNPILRTRIACLPQGMLQVVVRGGIPWSTVTEDIEPGTDIKKPQVDNGPLVQFSIAASQGCSFRIIIHHAIYDAWSLDILCEQAQHAYNGAKIDFHPANSFIPYLREHAGPLSAQFWKSEFAELRANHFPILRGITPGQGGTTIELKHTLPTAGTEFTISSSLRLAWALVLGLESGCDDVVFGATVTGRGADVEGISGFTGPTIATVPVRVQLRYDQSVQENLVQVHEQFARMIAFEQTGLQHIRLAGSEAATACEFQNLLVIQPRGRQQAMRQGIFDQPLPSADSSLTIGMDYPLTLICEVGEQSIVFKMSFAREAIAEQDAQRMLKQLTHVHDQVVVGGKKRLRNIDLVHPEDLARLKQWNNHIPPRSHVCVHDIILQTCRTRAKSAAVCGVDQQLTYGQLDRYSAYVGHCIVTKDIRPGDIVPLVFEKSTWTAVAMLAVLRAGAAFVLLTHSHPLQRLQDLVWQTRAKLILSSKACAKTSQQLHSEVIVVDSTIADFHAETCCLPCSLPKVSVTPEDPAFILFTSGSSGTPKGIVLPHRAITSGLTVRQKKMRMSPESRVFQYASYAFGVGVLDHLLSLMTGACICVPDEEVLRNNPTKAARDLQANRVLAVPSSMRLIEPRGVPSMQTVLIGGEPLRRELVREWEGQAILLHCYGSAECNVVATAYEGVREDDDLAKIGTGIEVATWVVDPADHHRLLPIGCVGELLLEGPTIASGYLNNPEQTAVAFVDCPQWLADIRAPGHAERLYKTGDLVRYCPDGSLVFLGRKDFQIKINGQRIEPGEIEQRILAQFPKVKEAVVDRVQLKCNNDQAVLVAFMSPHTKHIWGEPPHAERSCDLEVAQDPSSQFYLDMHDIAAWLGQNLPSYMVPSVFVPLTGLPKTATGKLDRRRLREVVAMWDRDRVSVYHTERLGRAGAQVAVTDEAKQMVTLVATVLNMDPTSVSANGNFFILGGDSIDATRLSMVAKEHGLLLTVQDIFLHPVLSDMAKVAKPLAVAEPRPSPQLLPPSESLLVEERAQKIKDIVSRVLKMPKMAVRVDSNFFDLGGDSVTSFELALIAKREGINLTEDTIFKSPVVIDMAAASQPVAFGTRRSDSEGSRIDALNGPPGSNEYERIYKQLPAELARSVVDAHPLSEFQQMTLTIMNYRYYCVALPPEFDRGRLCRACQALVDRHAIFRTVFTSANGEMVQLVLKEWPISIHSYEADDLDRHCSEDGATAQPPMSSGKPPLDVQLVTLKGTQDTFLVFRLAHALFDGFSLYNLIQDLSALYNGRSLPPTSSFLTHLRAAKAMRTEATYSIWRRVLHGSQMTSLRQHRLPVPAGTERAAPAYLVKAMKTIPRVSPPPNITLSTALKAAWAVTLLRYFAPITRCAEEATADVVFTQVFHGRELDVPHEDRIIGPCISTVPVRVSFQPSTCKLELLRTLQQQLLDTMSCAALEYQDIVKNCTSWAKTTPMGSFVRIRNYEIDPPCWLDGVACETTYKVLPNKPSESANVHIHPTGDELRVDITISSHVLSPGQVEYVVEDYCRNIEAFDINAIAREPAISAP
jgi:amino acid adenylation domain-containing protein